MHQNQLNTQAVEEVDVMDSMSKVIVGQGFARQINDKCTPAMGVDIRRRVTEPVHVLLIGFDHFSYLSLWWGWKATIKPRCGSRVNHTSRPYLEKVDLRFFVWINFDILLGKQR